MIGLGDVVWDVVLIGATASLSYFYRMRYLPWRFRMQVRHLFRFEKGSEVTLIIPTIKNPEFLEIEMIDQTTPLESVYASRYLSNYVHRIIGETGDLSIELSEKVTPEALRRNLIILGGPIHNERSRKLLDQCDMPLTFDGHELVSQSSGSRYSAEVENGRIVSDYTMVVSRVNPWNRDSHLVFIAACRGYGAIGAARFLVKGGVKKIVDAAGGRKSRGKNIHAVLSFRVDHFENGHFNVYNSKVEEVWLNE